MREAVGIMPLERLGRRIGSLRRHDRKIGGFRYRL